MLATWQRLSPQVYLSDPGRLAAATAPRESGPAIPGGIQLGWRERRALAKQARSLWVKGQPQPGELHQALAGLVTAGQLSALPLSDSVAAVSCGVVASGAVLDLDYAEDSQAETDANFVLTGRGGIVEIQATAEGAPFDEPLFAEMLRLARAGIGDLTRRQWIALGLGAR